MSVRRERLLEAERASPGACGACGARLEPGAVVFIGPSKTGGYLKTGSCCRDRALIDVSVAKVERGGRRSRDCAAAAGPVCVSAFGGLPPGLLKDK